MMRVREDDQRAFTDLLDRYRSRIFGHFYRLFGNRQDAEDLTARVFLRTLRHLEDYEPRGGGFGAWLFTIAHNLLSNWYRDRGRRRQQPLDSAPELSTASDPPSDFERAEEAEAVRRAVAGLGPERQRLITLKYVEGLSNREIGTELVISEHTAANHIRSILRKTRCANRTEAATYAHRHGLTD